MDNFPTPPFSGPAAAAAQPVAASPPGEDVTKSSLVVLRVTYGVTIKMDGEPISESMRTKLAVAASLLPPRGGRSAYTPSSAPLTAAVLRQAIAAERAMANDSSRLNWYEGICRAWDPDGGFADLPPETDLSDALLSDALFDVVDHDPMLPCTILDGVIDRVLGTEDHDLTFEYETIPTDTGEGELLTLVIEGGPAFVKTVVGGAAHHTEDGLWSYRITNGIEECVRDTQEGQWTSPTSATPSCRTTANTRFRIARRATRASAATCAR